MARNDLLGFSFSDIKAKLSDPKLTKAILANTEKYGAVVAQYYPPAAIALNAAKALQTKAQAGDPEALAKIQRIAAGATAGDPKAIASANLLKAANALDRQNASAADADDADAE